MLSYFSVAEWWLWIGSVLIIIISFCLFRSSHYLTLVASLVGVTSLIFNAKGNPIGQLLMIIFSLLYGLISYTFGYYGEMITYVGMTMPMALFAFIAWMKNPFKGKKTEVAIRKVTKQEVGIMCLLTVVVTIIFYFILRYFHTAYLLLSTLSVTTSFIAVYLTNKRSAYFAVAYACNDVVLIILWTLATCQNLQYISVVVCFVAFLINDIYGYVNWCKMEKRQKQS